jgi:hypothetical protein
MENNRGRGVIRYYIRAPTQLPLKSANEDSTDSWHGQEEAKKNLNPHHLLLQRQDLRLLLWGQQLDLLWSQTHDLLEQHCKRTKLKVRLLEG